MKSFTLFTCFIAMFACTIIVSAQGVNISTAGVATPSNTFTVGGSEQFQVNNSGNIVKINNVTTSWPASQGAAGSFLTNDGSGNLSWAQGAVVGGVSYTADGGVATTLMNGSGSTIVKGSIVKIMAGTSDRIEVQSTSSADIMPIGIAAADIPNGTAGPVTMAGVALVLVDGTSTVTAPSMMIFASGTVAGACQGTNSPSNNGNHWGEIGHNLTWSTTTGALIKVVLHFN